MPGTSSYEKKPAKYEENGVRGCRILHPIDTLNRYNIGLILSKYRIPSANINVSDIKQRMWQHFVDDAYTNGKVTFFIDLL